jgi:hypothetical protein
MTCFTFFIPLVRRFKASLAHSVSSTDAEKNLKTLGTPPAHVNGE